MTYQFHTLPDGHFESYLDWFISLVDNRIHTVLICGLSNERFLQHITKFSENLSFGDSLISGIDVIAYIFHKFRCLFIDIFHKVLENVFIEITIRKLVCTHPINHALERRNSRKVRILSHHEFHNFFHILGDFHRIIFNRLLGFTFLTVLSLKALM